MGFFAKVTDFLTGGTVSTIVDTVKDYFPPSMSDKEKAELSAKIREAEYQREKGLLELAVEADKEVTRRAAELEGTAKDLKTVPLIGPLVIFLRGCMRPTFGYFTLFVDWQIFSNAWKVKLTLDTGDFTAEGILIIALNILVLGFLFGERTVKNLMPLFTKFMEARK
ncbi:conserved protein of unknown function [Pseudodesulfovibrio profundus]|uniref:Uncharacterized protein n=1 Tax=Pseudodesulfovibrio profundus TaxID=57320 RepID=A0A2C8FCL8_9BACT|nr:hypothetical protein [Pseudodesulfovibrio profundus]MBC17034.1 hypothetical protein [Desulfovibrio sp.]SOB60534.1 conserved protein of unknown function [Pseudodesulfovibrio profundus]|tara:strand:+ start:162 stop:662 length:501 start_codon:yes stop_codon:yes gene_type:complete